MSWSEYDYRSAEAMEIALAESLRAQIVDAVAAHGEAVLVLAGGKTPLPLYRRLAASDAPWAQVTVLPGDERCVPHDHPACNFTALREAFAAAQGITLLPLTSVDGDVENSTRVARENLAGVQRDFAIVLLGMGNDAHTASLFPGAAQLDAALAPDAPDALRIDPVPLPTEAPFPRISLSAARLRRAASVHLLIAGQAKRDTLRRAQASHDARATPISTFLHDEHVRPHIHWSP